MEQTRAELDKAVAVWLEAHAAHRKYLEATESLYVVFAEGWGGTRRGLPEAFDSFRQALLADGVKTCAGLVAGKSKPAA